MLGLWRVRHRWTRMRRDRVNRHRLADANRAVATFPNTAGRMASGLPGELIVSLTSYPPRFATLLPTLKGLLDQTIRAERTILWVSEAALAEVPPAVRALEAHGLEIRGCRDVGPFTKLVPALHAFPAAFIATFDDDTYYPPDVLARLVAAYDRDEPMVIAARAHLARFASDGAALSYRDWEFNTASLRAVEPDTAIFPTGVGGVLYPPGSFAPEVLDEAAFLSLCPHADDLWFFLMQRRTGMRQARAPGAAPVINWLGSQDIGLRLYNIDAGGNDLQLRALERRYGMI